jgi:hypothetical protein
LLELVTGVAESVEDQMHIRASELEHVCEVEVVWKAKYLDFGSARRVARDAGTDVTSKRSLVLCRPLLDPDLGTKKQSCLNV